MRYIAFTQGKLRTKTYLLSLSTLISPLCFVISITRSLDEIHSIYTRQAQNKNKPIKSFNTDQFGKRSLRYFGATLWNRILVEIKESHSLTTFMKS